MKKSFSKAAQRFAGAALVGASLALTGMPAIGASNDFQIASNSAQSRHVITEYRGKNSPDALISEIKASSRGKTLFVMFHDPSCPHCRRLTSFFEQARSKTELDYEVLKVSVVDYRYTAALLGAAEGGVPETYIFNNGNNLGFFVGASRTIDPLLDMMAELHKTLSAPALPPSQQGMGQAPN
jgi:thioredoxin-like negative regulator of GroEL